MAKEIVKQWKDAVAKDKHGKNGASNTPKPGVYYISLFPPEVCVYHL